MAEDSDPDCLRLHLARAGVAIWLDRPKSVKIRKAMDRSVELIAVGVANLRGFRDSTLPLKDGLTLLVGPNNSGKTSVLRLLDWTLNQASEASLLGDEPLAHDELQLLMPARETRNAARRLVLAIRITDGRRWKRFQCVDGVAALRVGLVLPGVLRLNLGAPRRNEISDRGAALDLLRELRASVSFSLIPASRDARSESFRKAFRDAVLAKLEDRAIHARRSGAPAEYRTIKHALDEIRSVADSLVLPLWDEVRATLPPGLAASARVSTNLDPPSLVSWIADRASLRLATGDHDLGTVNPEEVGSGLQSLLELSLQQAREEPEDVDRIIAVEEPEAFLHPSAQRTLARMISEPAQGKRLVSTHSAILVDEARFGETVLVRDHSFFPPRDVSDETRAEINTALLVGWGAEMAFSRSVLLVEGEGDRAFYEGLRRRLARHSGDGRLDQLTIVPAGSKSAFAPWLRMLASYGTDGDRPIDWLIVADGDAATEVRKAHADAGLRLPSELRTALANAASARSHAPHEFTAATEEVNRVARGTGTRIHLSPIDLEHAVLTECSDEAADALSGRLGLVATSRDELEVALRKRKAPFRRAALAASLIWADVSPDSRSVLRQWIEPVTSASLAAQLVRGGG